MNDRRMLVVDSFKLLEKQKVHCKSKTKMDCIPRQGMSVMNRCYHCRRIRVANAAG